MVTTAFAEVSATPAAPPAAAPNPLISFAPILAIGLIFYVLMIRPQQKQAKDHRRLIDNLKAGDKVLTQGGIYGVVANLKGTSIILKIAENVKVEVSRSAISQVIVESSNGSPTPVKEVI